METAQHVARSSALDRLTLGSPLRQRRTAIIVAAALFAILAFAMVINFATVARMAQHNVARTFLLAIPLAALASLVPIAIIWWLDRHERESPWLYLGAVLWGMLIATALAIPANHGILSAIANWLRMNPEVADYFGKNAPLIIGAPIAGPLVEEITKGLGIALLFWLLRDEFDNVRDGFVYGALVGVGFNMLETPLYVANGLAQYGFAPWGIHFGGRFALFGLAGHALFSGLFGAFLGLARQTDRRWLKFAAPVIGIALAILSHAVNNALGLVIIVIARSLGQPLNDADPTADLPFHVSWIANTIKGLIIFLPFIGILLYMLWRSGQWERDVLRRELRDEMQDIVSTNDYQRIQLLTMFGSRRVEGVGARASDRIVNAQNELAFRKHRLRAAGKDPASDPLIAGWREEIRRLRAL
jgi:RsiW-degrading membrane proteinase PrsW (M82 family)